ITALETEKGFLMVFPDGLSYFFDRAGRIRNITYQESSLTIQYENDKVIKIEDEQGNALSIFYNSDGFIEQIICPDGTRLIYEYENGLLT
ncbi:hypothetical protein J7L49_03615, partial [Candidatus Bathyarchaeota archaeon]|nr:hypothetical protein [Candidatus Bathyarchaeota archaeon]